MGDVDRVPKDPPILLDHLHFVYRVTSQSPESPLWKLCLLSSRQNLLVVSYKTGPWPHLNNFSRGLQGKTVGLVTKVSKTEDLSVPFVLPGTCYNFQSLLPFFFWHTLNKNLTWVDTDSVVSRQNEGDEGLVVEMTHTEKTRVLYLFIWEEIRTLKRKILSWNFSKYLYENRLCIFQNINEKSTFLT